MLYDQIRYAEKVRRLYRLRHLLVQRSHPDVGSRLGYPKYSKQFYRVKKTLRKDGILDRQGKFVESLPNLWLAELPQSAKNRDQIKVLGHRVPYNVYLAVVSDPGKKRGELARELGVSKKAVYDALASLEKVGLVTIVDSAVSADKEAPLCRWLLRYIELAKIHTNTTGDISALFKSIPGYIGGPQARYVLDYESGRPIGPADMKILTYKPYVKVWKEITGDIAYFKNYPKKIEIELATPKDRTIWIDTLPYNRTK